MNSLLPAVLLRGCRKYPDLRAITLHLDDLYGASVGALVRRIGDYQCTGLYCSFMEDRFAMEGDAILAPLTELVRQLLFEPVTQGDGFLPEYVESEKKNLISTIESQLNDKRAYAMDQLLRYMCREDSFGIPRLGEKEQVAAITPEGLFAHYQTVLRTSPIELCYVGSSPAQTVAALLKDVFADLPHAPVYPAPQTAFHGSAGGEYCQEMEVSQAKLCMGFVAPATIRDRDFVAMQVFNGVFGGGMTSKLFMQIREKMSLCYAIGSGYHGSKGILTLSAGIDSAMADTVKQEILNQLDACRNGQITDEELTAAKQSLRSGLLAVYDSPGAIEGYFAPAVFSGLALTPAQYIEAVEQVTAEQVSAVARQVQLHTVFLLKGVGA